MEYKLDIHLSQVDWQTLKTLHEILEVFFFFFSLLILKIFFFQIPHSYQQLLSAEKTPTLCGTIPAFEGVIKTLEKFQEDNISAFQIVTAGIDKLEEYQNATADSPAYILAICKFYLFLITLINNYYSA